MTQPEPPISLELDPSGYITGLGRAEQSTQGFISTLGQLNASTAATGALLTKLAPARPMVAAFTGFSVAAANAQRQLAPLAATSKTTGANFDTLVKGSRQLARELPIGAAGARQVVTAVTQLGLATKGQERQVVGLAKAYATLGGANSENPAALAQSMTQLSRATGSGQSVDRVTKLGDSLTTVSAKSGSSALGVAQFSKAISSSATTSGIGATKILGIASAFTKMGEDGFGAANAFNKMANDLSRSVREGTPEIAKYAQIMGTTTQEVRALFEADPTEAITRITERIAQAGSNAPRLLESIGLEGPRNQRVIQSLVNSGGLRQGVSDAVAGYGSGSTQSAADEAFSGLADSTERLGAATQQVAEAFGAPLLGPLTTFTDALAGGAGRLAEALTVEGENSSKALTAVGYAAVGLLVAFKAIPALVNTLGLARLATSGPVRAFGAGLVQANGRDTGLGRVGRFLGAESYLREQSRTGNVPGSRIMAPVNARFDRAGQALGGAVGTQAQGAGLGRILTGGFVQAAGILARTSSENVRNVRVGAGFLGTPIQSIRAALGDPNARAGVGARRDAIAPRSEAHAAYSDYVKQLKKDFDQGKIGAQTFGRELGAATKTLAAETGRAGAAFRILGRELLAVGGQATAAAGTLAARAGRGVLSLAGGVPGLLIGGATAAYSIQSGANSARDERIDVGRNATNFLDDYAQAMGKATEATTTFSGAVDAQAKAAVKNTKSIEQATGAVTAQDERNAQAFGKKGRLRDYTEGSEEAVIRRLQGQLGGTGAGADEIMRIRADLINSGRSNGEVQRISAAIPQQGNLDQEFGSNLAAQVADIGEMAGRTGVRGFLASAQDRLTNDRTRTAETRFSIDSLGEGQKERATELVQGVQERMGRRAQVLKNPDQALGSAFEEIDAAINSAIETRQFDLAEELQRQVTSDVFTVSKNREKKLISVDDIVAAGGYTEALADRDSKFEAQYERGRGAGSDGRKRERDRGYATNVLVGNDGFAPNPLAQVFDYTGTGRVNQAFANITGPNAKNAENPGAQSEAIRTLIQETRAAGGSFQSLAANAADAANRVGALGESTEGAIVAIRAAARRQVQIEAPLQSSGERGVISMSQNAADAALRVGDSNYAKEVQEAGVAGLMEDQQAFLARANARVAQEQQIRLQRARATEDFNRQMLYSDQDYRTSMERQAEQFGISLVRTEEQYLVGRGRAIEGFNRQQRIAQRDFAKQMRRNSEDAARAMYDPYQRIQVASTWDPEMLFGNLDEQNDALARQLRTMQDLRKRGLSETAITLLQLNDPKNAQQASAVAEATAAQIEALNKAAGARMQLGGKLNADPANLGRSRANEDFRQSLADQNEQMQISLNQGEQDYRRTLRIMNEDNARALRIAGQDRDRFVQRSVDQQELALDRMAEDVRLSDQEIVQNLEQAQKNMNAVINGQALDLSTGVSSSLDNTSKLIDAWIKGDLAELLRAGGAAVGGLAGEAADAAAEAGTTTPPGGGTSNQARNGAPAGSAAGADAAADSGRGFGSVIKSGRVSSEYGQRNGRLHAGIDVAAPIGTPVYAYKGGEVIKAGGASGYGLAIYLNHGDGQVTRYGHLSGFDVRNGEKVKKGQQIGRSGNTGRSTGPHLHFETRQGGTPYNPRFAPFAQGGIVTQPTQALIGEAGDREAVIPLNRSGVEVLARAMQMFVSTEDSKTLRSAQGVTYATYDYSSTTHDNRMMIDTVMVKAESPRELLQQMESKRRRGNLTSGGRTR